MSTPDLRTYWPAADTMGPGIVRAIEAYAQACAEAARERAIEECENAIADKRWAQGDRDPPLGYMLGMQHAGNAVRALKEKK